MMNDNYHCYMKCDSYLWPPIHAQCLVQYLAQYFGASEFVMPYNAYCLFIMTLIVQDMRHIPE